MSKKPTNGKTPILSSRSGRKVSLRKNEAAPRILHQYKILISPKGELSLRKIKK